MQIDWFTFVAQLINFAILIALLKRYLYGPVIRAMDDREAGIAERLHDAEEAREKAEEARAEFENRTASFEQQKAQLLSDAASGAEKWKQQQLSEAREETAAARREWHAAMLAERENLMEELRLETARRATETAGRLISEFADSDLQSRVVARFLRALSETDKLPTDTSAQSLTVDSAAELSDRNQSALADALRAGFPNAQISFQTNPSLICGLELRLPQARFAWSVRECLAEIDSDLIDRLTHVTAAAQTSTGSGKDTQAGAAP